MSFDASVFQRHRGAPTQSMGPWIHLCASHTAWNCPKSYRRARRASLAGWDEDRWQKTRQSVTNLQKIQAWGMQYLSSDCISQAWTIHGSNLFWFGKQKSENIYMNLSCSIDSHSKIWNCWIQPAGKSPLEIWEIEIIWVCSPSFGRTCPIDLGYTYFSTKYKKKSKNQTNH